MDKFSSELMRGSLDLMVLSILADGPKYGYLIQQRLREASRDMARLQAGTLYPLLHRLEADKLIKSRWDDSTGRRRKWYDLSSRGPRPAEAAGPAMAGVRRLPAGAVGARVGSTRSARVSLLRGVRCRNESSSCTCRC